MKIFKIINVVVIFFCLNAWSQTELSDFIRNKVLFESKDLEQFTYWNKKEHNSLKDESYCMSELKNHFFPKSCFSYLQVIRELELDTKLKLQESVNSICKKIALATSNNFLLERYLELNNLSMSCRKHINIQINILEYRNKRKE